MSIKQGGNTIAGSVGVYPLNERNISNCITEIPQDIKLELNNGTLTLKAGSKVYVPNGAGVFDTVTIANDIVRTGGGQGTGKMLFYKNGTISAREAVAIVSGSTPPSSSLGNYLGWYDTTNNMIKLTSDGGSTWDSGWSFPFCITHDTSGAVFLDQVFNGFGYIGSTVFALPGIKWLSPARRNADGTLKNKENTNTTVLTTDYPYNDNIVLYMDENLLATAGSYVQSENEPSGSYIIWYKPSENILRAKSTGSWIIVNARIVFGKAQTSTSGIVRFSSIQPFHALNYNDTEFIGHQSKPSNKYIDLTPGASGTVYNMPEDGYLCVGALHPDDANWINIGIDVLDSYGNFLFNVGGTYNLNNQTHWFLVPVTKGFKVRIYNNDFTLNRLRFIYANGSV